MSNSDKPDEKDAEAPEEEDVEETSSEQGGTDEPDSEAHSETSDESTDEESLDETSDADDSDDASETDDTSEKDDNESAADTSDEEDSDDEDELDDDTSDSSDEASPEDEEPEEEDEPSADDASETDDSSEADESDAAEDDDIAADSDDDADDSSDEADGETDTSADDVDGVVMTEQSTNEAGDHQNKQPGVAAFFDHPDETLEAARQTRDSDYDEFDVFTPFPVHGMDEAMGLGRSWIPWVTFVAGLTGFLCAAALQFGTMTFDWPMIIGGKPFAPWPAFVPVMFELTVLIGGVTTGAVMLKAAGCFEPAEVLDPDLTNDRFAVWISANDENYDRQDVVEFARSLDPTEVRTFTDKAEPNG